ncbi:hypothetical protein F2Q69_00019621 [Brassica cretica]|uniref:Uncharacterized protein n=1 Tax=Brassica cretica TaxID=69181 RepID=A0A8S9Q3A7_BRACR|nr:hypothetical protein F2Q69_00019621 [Brassica cretica]
MTSRHTRSNTQGHLVTLSNQELARLERENRQQPRPTNTTMDDHGHQDDLAAAMQLMQQQMLQMQQTFQAQQTDAQQAALAQQEQQAQAAPIGTTFKDALCDSGSCVNLVSKGYCRRFGSSSSHASCISVFDVEKLKVVPEKEHGDKVTAPDESAETPPSRVYVPKVPYPIPPRHLMDPISEEQLIGFNKMVRKLPKELASEDALQIRPLFKFFKNCRETQEEIKVLYTKALSTPALKKS